MPKRKPMAALAWTSVAMISIALGCGNGAPNEQVATETSREELKRTWPVHEIVRGTDPPPFSLKVYVKLVYAQPRDKAAIRECLATAVEEFLQMMIRHEIGNSTSRSERARRNGSRKRISRSEMPRSICRVGRNSNQSSKQNLSKSIFPTV